MCSIGARFRGAQPPIPTLAQSADLANNFRIVPFPTPTCAIDRLRLYPNKFRVWISGQVRRVTKTIRREMKRRAAVEPVIGHVNAEYRMQLNYLKGRHGDRANAVFAAAGYNFSLLIRWLEALLRALLMALLRVPLAAQSA